MAVSYALSDPSTPMIPRYIGRTKQDTNKRLFAHLFEAYDLPDKALSKWLFSLWATRRLPVVTVYEIVSDADASHREMFWIRLFRKSGWLLNISDGPGPGKGRRPSELNIQRTIERNKRGWSEETRRKQIAVKTGRKLTPAQLLNRRNSPAVQAALKKLIAQNKLPKSKETIEKQRAAVKGRKLPEEQILDREASPLVKAARLAMVARNKLGWSETTRQKQIAIKTGRTLSPDQLQRRRSSPLVEAARLALIERNKTRTFN